MILHIKNMVCSCCIMVVTNELKKLNLPITKVSLGEVGLSRPLKTEEKEKLQKHLSPFGFELLDDKKSKITEPIKTIPH